MNKLVLATLCFAAGAGFGYAIGYYVNHKAEVEENKTPVEPIHMTEEPKKEEKPVVENPSGDIFKFKPAKIATPEQNGINYRKYVQELGYKEATEHPSDEDELEDEVDTENGLPEDEDEDLREECEETYEERLEREEDEREQAMEEYKRKNKGKIEPITQEEFTSDFRENDYDQQDLYYFTEDDVLCDEDGKQLDKEEHLGKKVGQIGWYRSPEDEIYICNHVLEKEYRVIKERCSVEDWWS